MNPPYTIEVCLTPRLFGDILTREHFLVVLVDILRATTSICAAFENGVERILPAASIEATRKMKAEGYLVASELDGKKLDFADFGNSALHFTREAIGGQTLVYCTTNGTRALDIAKQAEKIAIGAFVNLSALAGWLGQEQKNVVILCSGWKNKFCLEDTLFAGALTEKLLQNPDFVTRCDSAYAAMDLWQLAKDDVTGYLEKAAHRHRLRDLGLDDVIPYSLKPDSTRVVPVFRNGEIRNACI